MPPDLSKAEECRKRADELRAKAAVAHEGPQHALLSAAESYDYIARSIEKRARTLEALQRRFAQRVRKFQILY